MLKPDIEMTMAEFIFQKKIRLKIDAQKDCQDKQNFLRALNLNRSIDSFSEIKKFLEQIEKFEYDHGLLTKNQYLAHPYRVATLLINFIPEVSDEAIMLAICHNMIEVSGISQKLIKELGENLFNFVKVLTVDRECQWDWGYKKNYYLEIEKYKETRLIKIFDKLDNRFTLSMNADSEIKKKYLYEISTFLMPWVADDVPALYEQFNQTIEFNHQLI